MKANKEMLKEMEVTFIHNTIFGETYEVTMELRKEPISIFDHHHAGDIDTEGKYCIILMHNGIDYAVLREDYDDFLSKGKRLDDANEILCINGEKSRGMTETEERLWDQDYLDVDVDLWGNIRIYEFREGNEYETVDWFTGGYHRYKCVSRTESKVTFSAVYEELDGTYTGKEIFDIHKDGKDGDEYIVFYVYQGEENRMYAR